MLSERGIPVPGDSTQVIYVWFDALANYISGLGSTSVEDSFNLWKNAGRITARLDKVLCTSADVLQCIGELLLPYLPESAIEILRRLNAKTTAGLPIVCGRLTPGTHVELGGPLFVKRATGHGRADRVNV